MPKIPEAQRSAEVPSGGGLNVPQQSMGGQGIPNVPNMGNLGKSLGDLGKIFDRVAANKRAQDDLNTINKFKLDTTVALNDIIAKEQEHTQESAQGATQRFVAQSEELKARALQNIPDHLKEEATSEYGLRAESKRRAVIKWENVQRDEAIKNGRINSLAEKKDIVSDDPAQLETVATDFSDEIDDMTTVGGYGKAESEIYKRDGRNALGVTAVKSMIVDAAESEDPEQSYDNIKFILSDDFKKASAGTEGFTPINVLTEDSREELRALAIASKKNWQDTQRETKERMDKDVKKANQQALDSETNDILEDLLDVMQDPNANAADYKRVRDSATSPTLPQLSKTDNVKTRLNLLATIDNAMKDVVVEGDPAVYANTLERLSKPDELITMKISDINNMYITHKITDKQLTRLKSIFNSNSKDLPLDHQEAIRALKDMKTAKVFVHGSSDPEIQDILAKDTDSRTKPEKLKLIAENLRIYIGTMERYYDEVKAHPDADKTKILEKLTEPALEAETKSLLENFTTVMTLGIVGDLGEGKVKGFPSRAGYPGPDKKLTKEDVKALLKDTEGDKQQARDLARERGFEF